MTESCARVVEFSTDFLPEEERTAYWREHYGQVMLRVDLEPAKDAPFQACMTSLLLPGLNLIEASASSAKISRTGEHLADGNDDAVLAINRAGIAVVSSGGREEVLREHEAILMLGNEPTSFYRATHGQSFTIRMPRAMLRSIASDAEDSIMRLIPRNRSALGLLARYASWLLRTGTSLDAELLNLSERHIQDLFALTVGASSDFKEVARTRGLRAARLKLAKAYIIENCHRREISVGSVSAHLCVTPRYLQRLFEDDGTTFSEFLVTQRLARAHRQLCQADSVHAAISTIAYDAGFGDLSYFNRRFRRLYGVTPREVKGERSHNVTSILSEAQQHGGRSAND
jgi:AraC-like DNA-binding protein